jgi:hypothetical protein
MDVEEQKTIVEIIQEYVHVTVNDFPFFSFDWMDVVRDLLFPSTQVKLDALWLTPLLSIQQSTYCRPSQSKSKSYIRPSIQHHAGWFGNQIPLVLYNAHNASERYSPTCIDLMIEVCAMRPWEQDCILSDRVYPDPFSWHFYHGRWTLTRGKSKTKRRIQQPNTNDFQHAINLFDHFEYYENYIFLAPSDIQSKFELYDYDVTDVQPFRMNHLFGQDTVNRLIAKSRIDFIDNYDSEIHNDEPIAALDYLLDYDSREDPNFVLHSSCYDSRCSRQTRQNRARLFEEET